MHRPFVLATGFWLHTFRRIARSRLLLSVFSPMCLANFNIESRQKLLGSQSDSEKLYTYIFFGVVTVWNGTKCSTGRFLDLGC